MELATLEWEAQFNKHRLFRPLGQIPLSELEAITIVNTLVRPRLSDLIQLASTKARVTQSSRFSMKPLKLDQMTQRKWRIWFISAVIAFLCLAFPTGLSIRYAMEEMELRQVGELQVIAEEILRRSQKTGDQFFAAASLISASGLTSCTDAAIGQFRDVAMRSSYLSAVGLVQGNRLVCSSLGDHGNGFELGVPRTANGGVRSWVGVMIPLLSSQQSVNVYEKAGVAVLVHPGLVLDILERHPDYSAATVLMDPLLVTRQHGLIKAGWVDSVATGRIVDDDYFVAMQRSGISLALVAAPKRPVQVELRNLARKEVPLGLLFGVLLAATVFFLARNSLSFKAELAAAIRRKELFVVYQPVIQLSTGLCVGAEALVRWRQADGTLVRPDAFIPFAEENGLIRDITRLVLKTVARDAATLLKNRPHFHIGINLSPADLHTEETLSLLAEVTKESNLKAQNLVVEATERGFLDATRAGGVIQRIREMGIVVAIDDFGTGYSSLSVLATLPFDFLKIDKSFVDTMQGEGATSKVALHIIEMAKSLNLRMVAEGVETEAQWAALSDLGVELGQGWLFAKPMPVDEFVEFLSRPARVASVMSD